MAENGTIKRITFTLHDYTLADVRRLLEIPHKYLIIGYETCPNTKRRHIQGFINLDKNVRFKKAKETIGTQAHIERSRGSDTDNRKYCAKEGEFIESGEPQGQGKRSDLHAAAEIITQGGTLKRVAQEYPTQYILHSRGLKAYRDLISETTPRSTKTTCIVCVGKPGSGKSKYCLEQALLATGTDNFNSDLIYYKPRGDWWDGYHQQPAVIIDDYYGWLKYDELLKIMDRYPYRVPVKGSYEQFTSKYIFITSNIHIDKWYKFEGYNTAVISRRIELYYEFDINEHGEFIKVSYSSDLNVLRITGVIN